MYYVRLFILSLFPSMLSLCAWAAPEAPQPRPESSLASELRKTFYDAWNFELVKLDGESITIVNVLLALTLLLVGVSFARSMSHVLKRKLLQRFKLDMNLADAIEKAVYYILLIIITLVVLDIAHVPLTVFTLIGGALAIGIGLGSQNILSNFISGLILMMERGVRLGDIIEVEGKSGTVIAIGARCTHLRTYNHFVILIPNSKLLENPITNLTSEGDGMVYLSTSVSIMPAPHIRHQELCQILLNATSSVSGVITEPQPQIFLDNFDDGLLHYDIFYWSDLTGPIEKRRILSDINASILHSLQERNIAIAAPLRGVLHLDTPASHV